MYTSHIEYSTLFTYLPYYILHVFYITLLFTYSPYYIDYIHILYKTLPCIIDGGIIANNPSIVAVSKAMAHYPFLNINNIAVLSLGAGSFPRHTNVFSAGRGTVVGASSLTG